MFWFLTVIILIELGIFWLPNLRIPKPVVRRQLASFELKNVAGKTVGQVRHWPSLGEYVMIISLTDGTPGVKQRAGIYAGDCSRLGDLQYELTVLDAGRSSSTLRIPQEKLTTNTGLVVAVLVGIDYADEVVACGQLPAL